MYDALYIGRFQPFHNGHLHALRSILGENERVLIGIGSAQYFDQVDNPLRAEERAELISRVLENDGIDRDRYSIVLVPNVDDDNRWVSYLLETLPQFGCLYTGSSIVSRLVKEHGGVELRAVDFLDGVNATMVRERANLGVDYSDLVPKASFEYLKEIDFDDRMRKIILENADK